MCSPLSQLGARSQWPLVLQLVLPLCCVQQASKSALRPTTRSSANPPLLPLRLASATASCAQDWKYNKPLVVMYRESAVALLTTTHYLAIVIDDDACTRLRAATRWPLGKSSTPTAHNGSDTEPKSGAGHGVARSLPCSIVVLCARVFGSHSQTHLRVYYLVE